MTPYPQSRPDWSVIDTVLLDLDGTLLDQAYDNHIWRDLLPQRFAYDPERTLFADDNSKMLEAARSAGIRWVYGVRHWDTKGSRREHLDYPAVDAVADLHGAG